MVLEDTIVPSRRIVSSRNCHFSSLQSEKSPNPINEEAADQILNDSYCLNMGTPIRFKMAYKTKSFTRFDFSRSYQKSKIHFASSLLCAFKINFNRSSNSSLLSKLLSFENG
jgi:hypothetical protein